MLTAIKYHRNRTPFIHSFIIISSITKFILWRNILATNQTTLDIGKVNRKSLAYQTADLLRNGIIEGRLTPGTHLIETDLAKAMEVSRGVLREAFRMLEQEGLVESVTGKGTVVTCPSERDIKEIYSLRQLLEGEAVRLAAEKATKTDIEKLEKILSDMNHFVQTGDLTRVVAKDLEFHQKIWAIADHKKLRQVMEEMKVQITVFLHVNTQLYEYLATSPIEHKNILENIRNKDGQSASEQMNAHLEDALLTVTEYFRQVKEKIDNQAL